MAPPNPDLYPLLRHSIEWRLHGQEGGPQSVVAESWQPPPDMARTSHFASFPSWSRHSWTLPARPILLQSVIPDWWQKSRGLLEMPSGRHSNLTQCSPASESGRCSGGLGVCEAIPGSEIPTILPQNCIKPLLCVDFTQDTVDAETEYLRSPRGQRPPEKI